MGEDLQVTSWLKSAALAVAATLASSGVALADGGQVRARVEVDASAARSSGPVIDDRITERSGLLMHERGVLPWKDEEDVTIGVVIAEVSEPEPGFVVQLQVERNGEKSGPREVRCWLCTESELVDKTVESIGTVLDELPPPAAESTVTPAVSEPAAEPAREDLTPVSLDSDQPTRGLGGKGKAGVALLAGGGALVITGVALAIPGPKPLPDNPLQQRNLRPGGIAVLAVGGAAAVTGAVLLKLDRREARVAVNPAVGARFTGVSLSGRF